MALAEGSDGGFAGVYPILKELEDRGQVRRGYFVSGLGAAQFALPGAVDRLRDHRTAEFGEPDRHGDSDDLVVLAAVDPAQPYGAALPWPDTPGRPARAVGAYVVLHRGQPIVYLERGGKSLVTFPSVDGPTAVDDSRWVTALKRLVDERRLPTLMIAKVNGAPILEEPLIKDVLLGGGFSDGYRGPVYRR